MLLSKLAGVFFACLPALVQAGDDDWLSPVVSTYFPLYISGSDTQLLSCVFSTKISSL